MSKKWIPVLCAAAALLVLGGCEKKETQAAPADPNAPLELLV
jgi:hypothetical protein